MNIIIKGTNLELTPAIKDYVEKKAQSLEKYHDRIIEVRAEVELTTHHHHKGNIYRAEFNVRVPGELLRVEKTTKDMYKAIDKVKDHLVVMLKDYKEKVRDGGRRASQKMKK